MDLASPAVSGTSVYANGLMYIAMKFNRLFLNNHVYIISQALPPKKLTCSVLTQKSATHEAATSISEIL